MNQYPIFGQGMFRRMPHDPSMDKYNSELPILEIGDILIYSCNESGMNEWVIVGFEGCQSSGTSVEVSDCSSSEYAKCHHRKRVIALCLSSEYLMEVSYPRALCMLKVPDKIIKCESQEAQDL